MLACKNCTHSGFSTVNCFFICQMTEAISQESDKVKHLWTCLWELQSQIIDWPQMETALKKWQGIFL